MTGATETVHGTCVTFGDIGILLRGEPGAGKSDLALRLIDGGALLVADDRVALAADESRLLASAPPRIAGLLEVRGLGILRLPHAAAARLRLVADLVPTGTPERLPRPAWCEYLGCRIRLTEVAPFEHSAPAKLRLAAYAAAGLTDPATGAMPQRRDED